ncbi:MAG: hypothetical protein LBE76_05320 [Nitrososphaerota archaeon]|jgi:hypothetical protein|nr:hypothetical protein [Nitrososphaerota archaeon]
MKNILDDLSNQLSRPMPIRKNKYRLNEMVGVTFFAMLAGKRFYRNCRFIEVYQVQL